jgi:hypothetical protein
MYKVDQIQIYSVLRDIDQIQESSLYLSAYCGVPNIGHCQIQESALQCTVVF